MGTTAADDRVLPVHDLREYFRDSVDAALANQGVHVDPHAAHYVVNLLSLFSRSEDFYVDRTEGSGVKPLALLLVDAADAPTAEQRSHALQRIGDVALFVAGFFADSLAHRLVDLDYYIYMGGTAYGSLSDEIRGTTRGRALASVYEELAHKFQLVVEILNEVRDCARRESDIDLLRTYEVWLRTGSKRAAAMLRQHGIVPLEQSVTSRH